MTQTQREIDNEIRHHELLREMGDLKRIIENVSNQMQELWERIAVPPIENEELRMPEPYEHPWNQYQREQFVAGGNSKGNKEE
jgi:hypothetical protein